MGQYFFILTSCVQGVNTLRNYFLRARLSKREDELILKFKGTDRELSKLVGRSVRVIQIRRVRIKKESGLIIENILEPAT